jgi:biopolymer transport protein ExbD
MWGFVSIMLVLLFLLIEPMLFTDVPLRRSVDRAVATHSTLLPGALKEDAMQVTVMRDGQVFFRDHHVLPVELPNKIREGMRNGAEKRIYLAVDARARYGDAIVVLDQIRLAGIENVSFLTEKPHR